MTQLFIQHTGELAPDREKTYLHLPFAVPDGAVRLEVTYHYSDRISSDPLVTGGNTIDLGVFDEHGIEFLSAGFRGWSGSSREKFFITETEATPGYLAGALNPGQWHILLGLYKIAPQGCRYQVDITIATEEGHQAVKPLSSTGGNTTGIADGNLPADLPVGQVAAESARLYAPWLRGELHCHTYHSDGKLSPTELIELARSRGMDFLAISDHNTTAAQGELERMPSPGLVLIRGLEVTTFMGHFNLWGIPDWVDFRVQKPEDMEAAIQRAIDLGALTSCNHPKLYGPPWDYPEVANFHCVEVWNGPWSGLDEMALEYWTSLLAAGRRVPAVGGSDFHNAHEGERNIGTPTNWIYQPGKPDAAGILQAVRQGHVSLSDVPDGPFLELRAGQNLAAMGGDAVELPSSGGLPVRACCQHGDGCLAQILDQRGVVFEQAVNEPDASFDWTLSGSESRYIRVELRESSGRLRALTNPIYIATPALSP